MEAWIAHIPGLKVVMPSGARDAKGLLKAAIRDDNPVFYFENRHTYTIKEEVPECDYVVPSSGRCQARRSRPDHHRHRFMVHHALDAANVLAHEGIDVEVVDPRTLVPLDIATLSRSARKTGAC